MTTAFLPRVVAPATVVFSLCLLASTHAQDGGRGGFGGGRGCRDGGLDGGRGGEFAEPAPRTPNPNLKLGTYEVGDLVVTVPDYEAPDATTVGSTNVVPSGGFGGGGGGAGCAGSAAVCGPGAAPSALGDAIGGEGAVGAAPDSSATGAGLAPASGSAATGNVRRRVATATAGSREILIVNLQRPRA